MIKNKKKLIILIAIVVIIIIGVVMLIMPSQKVEYNESLNTEQISSLLKTASYVLTNSETLSEGSITDESMIDFAFCYMEVVGGYEINYDYETMMATTNLDSIENVVKYIFNKSIDYSKVSYPIENNIIEVPVKSSGGDAKIYKFKAKEYNSETDTYITYIDRLEGSASQVSEFIESEVTEYNPEYVLATLVFKYKEQDGRKILLAFNVEYNY